MALNTSGVYSFTSRAGDPGLIQGAVQSFRSLATEVCPSEPGVGTRRAGMDPEKQASALVSGLSRRIFFNDDAITDDIMVEKLFSGDTTGSVSLVMKAGPAIADSLMLLLIVAASQLVEIA